MVFWGNIANVNHTYWHFQSRKIGKRNCHSLSEVLQANEAKKDPNGHLWVIINFIQITFEVCCSDLKNKFEPTTEFIEL